MELYYRRTNIDFASYIIILFWLSNDFAAMLSRALTPLRNRENSVYVSVCGYFFAASHDIATILHPAIYKEECGNEINGKK